MTDITYEKLIEASNLINKYEPVINEKKVSVKPARNIKKNNWD